MSALIIGEAEERLIAKLKAEAAIRGEIDAELAIKQDPLALRDANTALTITLPVGFTVTYTLERQPSGLFQHLSVGTNRKGKSPNQYAVDMVLKAFGMKPHDESEAAWTEGIGDDRVAVNVLQRVKEKK